LNAYALVTLYVTITYWVREKAFLYVGKKRPSPIDIFVKNNQSLSLKERKFKVEKFYLKVLYF